MSGPTVDELSGSDITWADVVTGLDNIITNYSTYGLISGMAGIGCSFSTFLENALCSGLTAGHDVATFNVVVYLRLKSHPQSYFSGSLWRTGRPTRPRGIDPRTYEEPHKYGLGSI